MKDIDVDRMSEQVFYPPILSHTEKGKKGVLKDRVSEEKKRAIIIIKTVLSLSPPSFHEGEKKRPMRLLAYLTHRDSSFAV